MHIHRETLDSFAKNMSRTLFSIPYLNRQSATMNNVTTNSSIFVALLIPTNV